MSLRSCMFKLCYHPLRKRVAQFRQYSYEGAGKTTVSVLNKQNDTGFLINSFSQIGFRLTNNVLIVGPVILFPKCVLSWGVEKASKITEESLMLFKLLEPKVDVLILGLGNNEDSKLPYDVIRNITKMGTNVEILSTERAVGSYNFLVSEGRYVAAAMIPPINMKVSESDVVSSMISEGSFEKHMLEPKDSLI